MKLIPNWKKCWRMFSQQAFIVAGALQGVWLILDETQKQNIPDNWVNIITLTVVALGFIGRLVKQKKVD